MSVYFYFMFHIQIFFWFNFRYVAEQFYLKIGKSSNSAWLVVQMLFWNRWNQESAGRVYFKISREKPALVETWMDQSETPLLFFAETSQRQSCSRVPQSSWSLSSTCAEEFWVETGVRLVSYCINHIYLCTQAYSGDLLTFSAPTLDNKTNGCRFNFRH